MTDAHAPHGLHAVAAAPDAGADAGVDKDSIAYAIRSDLPADPVSRAEQAGVFGFTAVLSWVVTAAGIAAGGWLLFRANVAPSFFGYFSAFMAAFTGVVWGSAIRAVSRTGREVISHSAPTA